MFFQVGAVVRDGLCRRDPPGVFVLPVVSEVLVDGVVEFFEDSYVGWPEVFLHDWCGSFVDRESMKRHPSAQKPQNYGI